MNQEQGQRPAQPLAVVLIDRRILSQECLAESLRQAEYQVAAFPCVQSWLAAASARAHCGLVILCAPSGDHPDVGQLSREANGIPTILISDADDPRDAVVALENGVDGYLPTSMRLGEALEAMRLVAAGGTFVPARSLLEAVRQTPMKVPPVQFSPRQAEVAAQLCKGKPNKIIAYELNLSEATVKVHVRAIMKRLKVTNRTEAAHVLREMQLQECEL